MFSKHLTPKCLPLCGSHVDLPCFNKHVKLPSGEEITNEMKYHLFQMNDLWIRYCSCSYYHSEVPKCQVRFQSRFNHYLSLCTSIDQLEYNFARDVDDWSTILATNTQHSVQFRTRYHTRIAELKRERREVTKALFMEKLKLISIVGFPLIQCCNQLIRCSNTKYFSQCRDEDKTIVLNHLLNWIVCHAKPLIPLRRGVVQLIVSVLEHYIDFKMEREPERFIIRGVDYFVDQCCYKFFHGIELIKGREEAFVFLLVALRYQKNQNTTHMTKKSNSRKLLNENIFFMCKELVLMTASFLFHTDSIMSPRSMLWI